MAWRNTIFMMVVLAVFAACGTSDGRLINGATLPDISLPTVEGEELPLSSLKGDIVLVDVWASWCKPCRKQNPKIVALYNKYKDAGFKVYNISLDSDRNAWLKAIKADKLNWPYHVSELKGWNSKAVETFGIKAIPTSFLIDGDGMIIGKDLRAFELEKILEKRLGES